MSKKNLFYLIVIVIIVIVLIFLSSSKDKSSLQTENIPPTELDMELNEALLSDTTDLINDNLDNINVEDTTDEDLKVIDDELNNL